MLFAVVAFFLFLAICAVLATSRWGAHARKPAVLVVVCLSLVGLCVSAAAYIFFAGARLHVEGRVLEAFEWIALSAFVLFPAAVSVGLAQALLSTGVSQSVVQWAAGAAGVLALAFAPFGWFLAMCGVFNHCG
jgi:hypothetical protein